MPPLDSNLASPCKPLPDPNSGDLSDFLDWAMDIIGLYGDCAVKHAKTVNAWESAR